MKYIAFTTVIIALISCSEIQKSNDFDRESIIEEVNLMLNKYHEDIGREGLTAEFKYLDQSPDFFWVPPGYDKSLSYDSVKDILEANAKAYSSIEFHWDTLQIFPLSSEMISKNS